MYAYFHVLVGLYVEAFDFERVAWFVAGGAVSFDFFYGYAYAIVHVSSALAIISS